MTKHLDMSQYMHKYYIYSKKINQWQAMCSINFMRLINDISKFIFPQIQTSNLSQLPINHFRESPL